MPSLCSPALPGSRTWVAWAVRHCQSIDGADTSRGTSLSYPPQAARGHGVGAISTYDLELVTLADTVPNIRNYHFRAAIHDGRMVFDYLLRPGPCPTTNALKIMQMEGLPVEVD